MTGAAHSTAFRGRLKGWTLSTLALWAALAAPAWGDFSGRVVAVNDGDTITLLVDRMEHRVRLHGIDAPERGQAYGNAARQSLARQVAGRTARVVEQGRDGYGRILGRVFVDGIDVNAEQVRTGHAWVYRRYAADPRLLALEAEAKAARRGLWRDPVPVPPWQWRERRSPSPAIVP